MDIPVNIIKKTTFRFSKYWETFLQQILNKFYSPHLDQLSGTRFSLCTAREKQCRAYFNTQGDQSHRLTRKWWRRFVKLERQNRTVVAMYFSNAPIASTTWQITQINVVRWKEICLFSLKHQTNHRVPLWLLLKCHALSVAKWTVWARDWLAKCEGAGGGGKLKGEITWRRIGDWQIVGKRRGWQIKGVAKSGGALYNQYIYTIITLYVLFVANIKT